MSLVEDQAQLALVNAAINSILSGKVLEERAPGAGRSMKMLDLDSLYRAKDKLERRINTSTRDSRSAAVREFKSD